MKISGNTTNNITLLTLAGRFDAYAVPEVRSWMEQNNKSGRLIVDLQEVNFVDSTALAALVQQMKHCRQQQGDLVLVNFQQPVRIIFELTRLDKAFVIQDSVETAVQYLNANKITA